MKTAIKIEAEKLLSELEFIYRTSSWRENSEMKKREAAIRSQLGEIYSSARATRSLPEVKNDYSRAN